MKPICIIYNSSKENDIMPVNKNAALRYAVLDKCFRKKYSKCFWEDLAKECVYALNDINPNITYVSRRTILNDIAFMKSEVGYKAPIKSIRDGNRVYYRYSDEDFSIFTQVITPLEKDIIKNIHDLFSVISGRIEYQYLIDLLPKLEIDSRKDTKKEILISYEENQYLRNYKGLGNLFIAIKEKQPLKVIYKPYEEKEMDIIIHPYFLKQYNNRWFLFALHEESKLNGIHPIVFALDRFEKIENCYIEYIPNSEIDFSTYFDNIIGVTKPVNEKIQKITFAVTDQLKPYLETKPMHHSQTKFKQFGSLFKSSIQVIPNYEMYSLFLSFGKDLIILSPEEEIQKMKKEISYLNSFYNKK